jgi:dihydroorotate dehydrogenase electron transfer subunit
MPVDIEAKVIRNTRLSSDYNVIALAAPEIAATGCSGPVRDGEAGPLQRSAAASSILGVRNPPRERPCVGPHAPQQARRRHDTHAARAVEGDIVSCLGPLGKPFEVVDPPADAWMVAGGVGLAPFATLAEALVERGTPTTLFYGARSGGELFYLDWFASRGVRLILATEDGSTGERGRVTLPLERELQRADGSVMIYACGPEPMLEAVAHVSAKYGDAVRCRWNA